MIVAAVIGIVGGALGIISWCQNQWDRHIRVRRLGVERVRAHTRRLNVTGKSRDDTGMDVIVDNVGPLPVTIERLWFAPAADAKQFLAKGGKRYDVAGLDPYRPVQPQQFEHILRGVDRRISSGSTLVIHLEDWTAGGVPLGVEEEHFSQGYGHILSPVPRTIDEVHAIVGHGERDGSARELEVWLQLVDYEGREWLKCGRQVWRVPNRSGWRRRVRLRRLIWLEQRPWFLWVDAGLVNWVVRGASKSPRSGERRAWLVERFSGWRPGPTDIHMHQFLPKLWRWDELAEMAADPQRSAQYAADCRSTYKAAKKELGRAPTHAEQYERFEKLRNSRQTAFSDPAGDSQQEG
ncbi:Uncharacterised protein [Mycobacteroides abscessus subsp. abscessus]|nr:Uncharacterised protein [Mycobacteroides abscessus subsp. abscessus]